MIKMTTFLSIAKRRLYIAFCVGVTAVLFSSIFIMSFFTEFYAQKFGSRFSSGIKYDTVTTNQHDSTNNNFIDVMDDLHKQRIINLENTCRKSKLFDKHKTSKINQGSIYFEPYKAAICDIQKCGSSAWLKAVVVAAGYYNKSGYYSQEEYRNISGPKVFDLVDSRRFQVMNPHDAMKAWLQSIKIIMVRNPFGRLVSAYFGKLDPNGEGFTNFYRQISEKINQQYRSKRLNRPNAGVLKNDTTATFEDFVNFLLDTKPEYYDYHWALYEQVCDPCRYAHDIVAKLETLVYDVAYIRRRLNLSEKDAQVFFPNVTDHSDNVKVRKTFLSVSIASAYRLYKIYQIDFERFGYEMPSWLRKFHPS